ncbi:hypothetical protein GCM10017691_09220 [Pseudonocardia petroleophila]|uniref:ABC3 transporter permease C-terminal domain-containing protein n=1 Tax=Pseudonocardia petroleophila TaxID=37331 RepID=A0A7G7MJC7_9PSEU|nr:FtsX-like permease family protein [Pseudonocardia petroleophila]QNG52888.1 hypothetical protein H6H00_02210 [Pseudonocardia petroleophila]
MSAVRAVARAELRARWRSLLVLALVLGIGGGAALGTVALAQRTATAYPRLVEAVHLDDARVVVPDDQPDLTAAVPTMPGVARAWTTDGWVAQVEGPVLRYVSIGAGVDQPADLVDPVVVDGRLPAPDAAGELLIGEPFAQASGLRVGDRLTLKLLTLEEISQFAVGFGEPDGATAPMEVVGIGRMPYWGGALSNTLAGPAFARAHAADASTHPTYVRLDGSPGAAEAFSAAFTGAAAQQPPSIVGMYLPARIELPRTQVDPAVATAERVLTTGLAVVALVLAGGVLLVVGQGLARQHESARAAQRVEAALGLTAVGRIGARVLAALPAAAVAALCGGAVAAASGRLEALGSQARFEPTPGYLAPWGVALGGGALLAVLFVGLTVLATAVAGRPRRAPQAAAAGPPWWRPGRPALRLGVALRGGHRRHAVAVLGAAAVVAGVVAGATFGAGLQRLVDTPARYGQQADLSLIDAREPDVARLVADPRVAALDVMTSADAVTAAGEPLKVVALDHRLGRMPVETPSGREPGRPGEIAVGPRLAERLGVVVGDVLEVAGPGGPVALTVTGTVVVLSEDSGETSALGEVALVMPEQLPAVAGGEPLVGAYLQTVPGQAGPLFDELSRDLEVFLAETPDEIRNLADIVELPELLALGLAVVGAAGLVHAVLTGVRRTAPSLAALAVLGATPRQVCTAVVVMALSIAAPALLIGVPLGLAVARLLWWEVATSTGVGGDVALPVGLLVAIGPLVLLTAVAAAVRPALRVARTPPAAVLRES